MDKIIIQDLEVYAYHGVAEEEKKLGQMFVVSLELSIDLEAAAQNNDLQSTVNYAEVCDTVRTGLQLEKCDLIEKAAMNVIENIFEVFEKILTVKIILKKPWAPMGHHLKYVAVELERTRSGINGL